MRRIYGLLLLAAQVALGVRVLRRMVRTSGGERLRAARTDARCDVLLPVLDEEDRLGPCLAALALTDDTVGRILVVDGGSTDGTRELVREAAARHPRVELLEAGPAPEGVNGKAWQLQRGVDHLSRGPAPAGAGRAGTPAATSGSAAGTGGVEPLPYPDDADGGVGTVQPASERRLDLSPGVNPRATADRSAPAWLLTIDADVEVAPRLPGSMVARAEAEGLRLLSAGTSQRVADPLGAALHASMLTTLVYRFGVPGPATSDPAEVQANGQCFLIRRDLLEELGGFAAVQGEIAEDVALARAAARAGERVGFVEAGPLATAAMYPDWRATWAGWLRSLPLADRHAPDRADLGLLEVTLVQAAPLVLLPYSRLAGHRLAAGVNAALLAARLGTLAGTRRAYVSPPPAYWLSPLADPAVAVGLWLSRARRTHRWRGREVRRGESAR